MFDMFDGHADTATRIFDVPIQDVTPEQRQYAKNQNYFAAYAAMHPPKDYFKGM